MSTENFADLLEESLSAQTGFLGGVVSGTVIGIDGDAVTIDVGLKSEGRIPLKEFGIGPDAPVITSGDKIDVFVERYEDKDGLVRLSREKARREEAWTALEKLFQAGTRVNGTIFGR
ncbi:MAG: S1 RNA-binding domain-containing protein, partial [Rhodospirillaceae bacterium]|nr:S1 RNA-binding domain-containing protein [Rhodospirillaceae bacterium]